MIDPQRYPRLSRIQVPADLRRFPEEELGAIADELRAYLIEQVAKVGGHFGAGLGVIELTVALHWLYETPVDRLVFSIRANVRLNPGTEAVNFDAVMRPGSSLYEVRKPEQGRERLA